METLPASEAPKNDLERPGTTIDGNFDERPVAATEDERNLDEVNGQIDSLRLELQTLEDVRERAREADREHGEETFKGTQTKILGIFRRKGAEVAGRLSSEQVREIERASTNAAERLDRLLATRDDLEERVLDLEVLRERRKTRVSDAYVQALRESGRAMTGSERYQLGKGEKSWGIVIDAQIEALKKRRN